MLEHLGEQEAAAAIVTAIERVMAEGRARTRDLGGSASTAELAEAIRGAVLAPGVPGLTQ